ncbi:PREDICTED: uncharacterized protein LOC106816277 [Priapulus caudatus]|uniref:Uncharacterized protein LOC106816277 n=1 Tax=Priapulus caudatus TaxID=37621 RepID=A0ABM1EVX5_PRICU|nr:PREDICTED: uncharacterized protein LOC106816277 [Priapulus caudatus]
MVYCSAVNCHNGSGSGRSFHAFPNVKDKKELREKWHVAMRRQGDRPGSVWQPSTWAKLCSDHFLPEDFVMPPDFCASINYKLNVKPQLKDGAVPSRFTHSGIQEKKQRRGALEKRRRLEQSQMVDDLINKSLSEDASAESEMMMDMMEEHDEDQEDVTQPEDNSPQHVGTQFQPHCLPAASQTIWYRRHIGVQTCNPYSSKTKGTQCNLPPKPEIPQLGQNEMSKMTSCTQTEPVLNTSSSVQCCLIGEPLVFDVAAQETDSSDDEMQWEDNDDEDYLPSSASEDSCSDDDEPEEDWVTMADETYDKRPEKMRKFIVFESCLRTLMSVCMP